jgi:hypothetical protein
MPQKCHFNENLVLLLDYALKICHVYENFLLDYALKIWHVYSNLVLLLDYAL